jgi:hypothetical protein
LERKVPQQGWKVKVNEHCAILTTNLFPHDFDLKKWSIKKLDKIRRGFLWKGSEEEKGGHCLVHWAKVQKPKQLVGLGVLDLSYSAGLCA